MKIAVIPARGGSKRIPRKNIKDFVGKPMIAWSIEAAMKSKYFDRIIVSTDDDEIAQISINYAAEVPFIRTEKFSDDQVTTVPVVAHAIKLLVNNSYIAEFVCCTYATAPFINQNENDYVFK